MQGVTLTAARAVGRRIRRTQEAERAQRLQQEQAAAIQAERQHELQKLELTWKQTVSATELPPLGLLALCAVRGV